MACWWISTSSPSRGNRSALFWIWMPPMIRCTESRKGDSFMLTTAAIAICRCTSSLTSTWSARGCGRRISMPRPGRWKRSSASLKGYASPGPTRRSSCAPTRFLPGCPDELVREEPGRVCLRTGQKRAAGEEAAQPHARGARAMEEDRQAGAPLPRLPLSHAGILETRAAGRGQSRIPGQRREPALRGHLDRHRGDGSPQLVRGFLLRSRRDGEPYQGTATRFVCRSDLYQLAALQPDSSVSVFHFVLPPVSLAPVGSGGHRHGQGTVWDDSPAAAENRRTGTDHRAQNLDLDGCRPPRCGGVCGGASEANGRDAATRLKSIGSARELQVLLFRLRFQAAHGTCRANLPENPSPLRIKAAPSHSSALRGSHRDVRNPLRSLTNSKTNSACNSLARRV